MDRGTSIGEVKERVRQFCEDRDWDKFHGAKDLAIGIVTEASELLEHFRFLSKKQLADVFSNPAKRKQIEEELADVFFFVLRFAQLFRVDLDQSLERKLRLNAVKYPIKKARG